MSNHSAMLKESREAKGLTLDIVHEATKIPLDALKAIEQGYSVRLLTPFYYRGFVKIYAEFLGLDLDAVFKAYNMERTEKTPVAPMKKSVGQEKDILRRPAVKLAKVQIPNPLADQWQTVANSLGNWKVAKFLPRLLILLAVAFVLGKVGGCILSPNKNKPKPAAFVHVGQVKPASAAKVEATRSLPSETVKAKSAAAHKVEVVIRAVKNNWINVKTDGTTVFAATIQKGTVESWVARESIELSGKNISELELEVNGKHVGFLGTKERRAKKVIITKDGLTVKK